jgi:hypothetical protein
MTNEEQAKKVQQCIDHARRSVARWRGEHEIHNDASSRRLLANALIYAAGTLASLFLLGLVGDDIREECDRWYDEAQEIQKV